MASPVLVWPENITFPGGGDGAYSRSSVTQFCLKTCGKAWISGTGETTGNSLYFDDWLSVQVDGGQVDSYFFLWSYGCFGYSPGDANFTTNWGSGEAIQPPSEPVIPVNVSALLPGNHSIRLAVFNCAGSAGNSATFLVVKQLQRMSIVLPCGSSSVFLNASSWIAAAGTWQIVSGSGAIGNSSDVSTIVLLLQPGLTVIRYSFNWTGGCGVDYEEHNVTIPALRPNNIVRIAPACQALCGVNSTFLSASSQYPGVWSVESGGGSFSHPSNLTTNVSDFFFGRNVYRFSGCPSTVFAETVVSVGAADAVTVNAGPDVSLSCDAPLANLAAVSTDGGVWSTDSGSAVVHDACDPLSLFSIPVGTTSVLRWTGCPTSVFDTVTVSRTLPVSVSAGVDEFLGCRRSTSLSASFPPPEMTGEWSVVSGAARFFDKFNPRTSVYSVSTNTTLAWTVSAGGCTPSIGVVNLGVLSSFDSQCESCVSVLVSANASVSSCDLDLSVEIESSAEFALPFNFTEMRIVKSTDLVFKGLIVVAKGFRVTERVAVTIDARAGLQVGALVVDSQGNMTLGPGTRALVSGSASVFGSISVDESASLVLNDTLALYPSTVVEYSISSAPNRPVRAAFVAFAGTLVLKLKGSVSSSRRRVAETFVVAEYGGYNGTFDNIAIETGSGCDVVSASPLYSSSSLSVTLSVSKSVECSASSGALSSGAIIGIVLGSVVVAVVVVTALIVVCRKRELARKQANFALRERAKSFK